MADILCPNCNKRVSENASACPKCGEPITEQTVFESKEKIKKVRKKTRGFVFVIFICLVVIVAVNKFGSYLEDKEPAKPVSQKVEKQKLILGFDAQDYMSRFRVQASKMNLAITDEKYLSGEANDSIEANVGCCAYLEITTTKTNPAKVVEVIVSLGGGDGSTAAAAQKLLALATLIMTTQPGKDSSFRGQILRDLGFMDGKLPVESKTVRGDYRYRVLNYPGMGLMVGVDRAQ